MVLHTIQGYIYRYLSGCDTVPIYIWLGWCAVRCAGRRNAHPLCTWRDLCLCLSKWINTMDDKGTRDTAWLGGVPRSMIVHRSPRCSLLAGYWFNRTIAVSIAFGGRIREVWGWGLYRRCWFRLASAHSFHGNEYRHLGMNRERYHILNVHVCKRFILNQRIAAEC